MKPTITTDPLPGSCIYFYTPTAFSKKELLYPLCVGDFTCDEHYLIQRNCYDSFLIMFVDSGEGYLDYEGERFRLKENDLIFLDCYLPHSYGTDSNWHIQWIHFDGSSARSYYNMYRSQHDPVLHLTKSSSKSILKPLRTMIAGFDAQQPVSEIWLTKYITDLLTYTLEFSEDQQELTPGITEQVLYHIQKNFQQPLSIEQLAETLALNPSYLIRRFKKDTGMSPYQYLTSIRIEQAQYELKTTKRSVKDIGFSCGYQSENSFCITFRKTTGLTPTQFRQNMVSGSPMV